MRQVQGSVLDSCRSRATPPSWPCRPLQRRGPGQRTGGAREPPKIRANQRTRYKPPTRPTHQEGGAPAGDWVLLMALSNPGVLPLVFWTVTGPCSSWMKRSRRNQGEHPKRHATFWRCAALQLAQALAAACQVDVPPVLKSGPPSSITMLFSPLVAFLTQREGEAWASVQKDVTCRACPTAHGSCPGRSQEGPVCLEDSRHLINNAYPFCNTPNTICRLHRHTGQEDLLPCCPALASAGIRYPPRRPQVSCARSKMHVSEAVPCLTWSYLK